MNHRRDPRETRVFIHGERLHEDLEGDLRPHVTELRTIKIEPDAVRRMIGRRIEPLEASSGVDEQRLFTVYKLHRQQSEVQLIQGVQHP